MSRKRSETITDGELRLMRVLWAEQRATVGEVWAGLPGPDRPSYKSVQTLLRILEQKGYVRHEKDGRAFVYVPLIDRERARRGAVARLLRQFFDGRPGLLALNILEREQLDARELAEVKRLLKQAGRPRES
ncbi:MAG: BlaI/MecI/CopY family transcriptional regulator [Vicinamibacteraceae bacterium]